jgi:hypothetical protein
VYGTSTLWYVLADANGLSDPNATLTAGVQLKAPSASVNVNDANTFKPYNPSEATGPTSPSLPYVPPPPSSGCSALATLIRIIAVVVVIVLQQYELIPAAVAVGAGGEAVAQTVEINQGYRQGYNWGAVAVAGISAAWGGSKWVTTGNNTFNVIANAAITTSINYTTSYAVNRMTGVEDHFSLRQMLAGAVTAAIASGVFKGRGQANGQGAAPPAAHNWSEVAREALKGVAYSVVRQGIGNQVDKAFHLETSWNWRLVAAGALVDGARAGASAWDWRNWTNEKSNDRKLEKNGPALNVKLKGLGINGRIVAGIASEVGEEQAGRSLERVAHAREVIAGLTGSRGTAPAPFSQEEASAMLLLAGLNSNGDPLTGVSRDAYQNNVWSHVGHGLDPTYGGYYARGLPAPVRGENYMDWRDAFFGFDMAVQEATFIHGHTPTVDPPAAVLASNGSVIPLETPSIARRFLRWLDDSISSPVGQILLPTINAYNSAASQANQRHVAFWQNTMIHQPEWVQRLAGNAPMHVPEIKLEGIVDGFAPGVLTWMDHGYHLPDNPLKITAGSYMAFGNFSWPDRRRPHKLVFRRQGL